MAKRGNLPTPDGRQQCRECQIVKPIADFEPARHRACGITAGCRKCLAREREVLAILKAAHDEWTERHYAPTIVPDYQPEPIPEEDRRTAEYFRGVDAARRRERLQQRG